MRPFLFAALLATATATLGTAGADPDPGKASPVGKAQPQQTPAKPETKPSKPKPPPPKPVEAGPPHDFTAEAKALFAVGACGDLPPPEGFPQKVLEKHCDDVKKAQDDYKEKWVKPAGEFMAAHVPKDIPKKVVYPFAGGDLSTALTVFPDADEITTLSLEPAGDPRDLAILKGKDLERALATVAYELKFLYRVNFSNTKNMIEAMREGTLPTQLIFGLSALKIHGYEIVSLKYFRLEEDGSIHYLDDADLQKIPETANNKADYRNRIFSNAEIQFKKPGGRVQVYRHIRANLENPWVKKDPRVIKHLESKGDVAAMTKAASYLLSFDSFSNVRDYLIKHAVWMVSDATGIAPKWGKPAGFEYETYGQYTGPHMAAGTSISPDWKKEFAAEPKRELAFRFGYYDKKNANHLVIVRKKS